MASIRSDTTTGRDTVIDEPAPLDDARETLRRLADTIDADVLSALSTIRAGIAGALGALS